MSQEKFDRVKDIIVEQFGVSPEHVSEEAHIRDDLGADSLDEVELIIALETQFGIEIADEVADNFDTVGDIVKFLDESAV